MKTKPMTTYRLILPPHDPSNVYVIEEGELPKQYLGGCVHDFGADNCPKAGYECRTGCCYYAEALAAALKEKAVKLVDNARRWKTQFGEGTMVVGQLYDVPEGFRVEITEHFYDFVESKMVKTARIVPVKSEESDQDELWDEVVNLAGVTAFDEIDEASKLHGLLKSKYRITRK